MNVHTGFQKHIQDYNNCFKLDNGAEKVFARQLFVLVGTFLLLTHCDQSGSRLKLRTRVTG
jgi:hypothetical protein